MTTRKGTIRIHGRLLMQAFLFVLDAGIDFSTQYIRPVSADSGPRALMEYCGDAITLSDCESVRIMPALVNLGLPVMPSL